MSFKKVPAYDALMLLTHTESQAVNTLYSPNASTACVCRLDLLISGLHIRRPGCRCSCSVARKLTTASRNRDVSFPRAPSSVSSPCSALQCRSSLLNYFFLTLQTGRCVTTHRPAPARHRTCCGKTIIKICEWLARPFSCCLGNNGQNGVDSPQYGPASLPAGSSNHLAARAPAAPQVCCLF